MFWTFPKIQQWIRLKFDEWICQNDMPGSKLKIVIWGVHVNFQCIPLMALRVPAKLYHPLDYLLEVEPIGFVFRFNHREHTVQKIPTISGVFVGLIIKGPPHPKDLPSIFPMIQLIFVCFSLRLHCPVCSFRLASVQLRHATDVHEGIDKAHRSAACVPV